ncbi:MAG: polysaccharide deacetylase family protein [Opitutales bacterium]|nr:polysaccharide deacetylase family protein [Opitutales bacterium]
MRFSVISFDDGLTTCFEQTIELLKKYQLEATFFIVTNTLNNKALAHEHLSSLIAHLLKTKYTSQKSISQIESILSISLTQNIRSLTKEIRLLPQKNIDELCKSIQLDAQDYLDREKPYLTNCQIEKLIEGGFTIGAHSCSHPNFAEISLEEQIYETIESAKLIQKNFGLKKIPFAFPYLRVPDNPVYFSEIKKTGLISEFYGQHGLIWDKSLPFIPRISIEAENAELPINVILKKEKKIQRKRFVKTLNRKIKSFI